MRTSPRRAPLPVAALALALGSCGAATERPEGCPAGGCPAAPPSCVGLATRCGAGEDCCSSPLVPGGSFYREEPSGEAAPPVQAPATVTAFRLDRYEVTVGRFRAFFRSFDAWRAAGHPIPGEGAHPRVAGSGWQPGWPLAMTTEELQIPARCLGVQMTWTTSPSDHETLPINCINWFEAFAFCSWDGGRLPTEAEWEYAAAGGAEQRIYPWGNTEPGADARLAVHGCHFAGGPECTDGDIAPVGSAPEGDGRFGQADLAGGIYEWVFDWFRTPYPRPCEDCAQNTADTSGMVFRGLRGGSWSHHAGRLPVGARYGDSSGGHGAYTGIRCAR